MRKITVPRDPDLPGIAYFRKPNLVESLGGITHVYAGTDYCYALNTGANELYSWGAGDNCVLGNRADDNEFEPKLVHPKMFRECQIWGVGAGTSHVAVLAGATTEDKTQP